MEVGEDLPGFEEGLRNKGFLQLLNTPNGLVEEALVETVKGLTERLKTTILGLQDASADDILRAIHTFQSKIDQIIHQNFKLEKHLQEKPEITEKSLEDDEKSLENHEKLKDSVKKTEKFSIIVENQADIPDSPRVISPSFITTDSADLKLTPFEEGSNPVEDSLKSLEDDENFIEDPASEVISNLFSRILEIFYKDGRNLQNLFESIDVSKDGKITCQELRVELLKHDETITQEECEEVFKILDGNKDGSISLDELQKRVRLLHEKAEAEAIDPLAHMVFSKALDPSLTHGSLSVILQKVSNMKAGTHSIKVKVKDSLEYLTPDTMETNPNFNFRCDFLFENKTLEQIPKSVEFELYNKGKIEGTGSFNWLKAMNSPNSFSLKVKTDAKTSTGQIRGTFFFAVKWTPIVWKETKKDDARKMESLKIASEKHKRHLSQRVEKKELEDEKIENVHDIEDFKDFDDSEMPDGLERSCSTVEKPGEFFYVVEKTYKVIERSFTNNRRAKAKSGIQQMTNKDYSAGITALTVNKGLTASKNKNK